MNPFFDRFTDGVEGIPRHTITRQNVGGKKRLLYKPNEAMAEVQKRILKFFRGCAPKFHSSYSGKGGGGSVKNARKHQAKYRFKLDIKSAFPSTQIERLVPIIAHRAQYMTGCGATALEWLEFLQQYCISKEGTLPEGARTSSFLFEWYCEVFLDSPLRRSRSGWGNIVVYTRYADDLVLSSHWPIGRRRKRRVVRQLLQSAGFRENPEKTVYMRRKDPLCVTGCYVGQLHPNTIGVPRAWLKDTERMLYQANTKGVTECGHAPASIQGRVMHLLDVLRGRRTGLTSLETKVLNQYRVYSAKAGQDSGWAEQTLKRLHKDVVK